MRQKVSAEKINRFMKALSRAGKNSANIYFVGGRMIELRLVDPSRLPDFFSQIEDRFYKYPAIDAKEFRAAVQTLLKSL